MEYNYQPVRSLTQLFTPHTCWIIGAGASYDCISNLEEGCIPLTANLVSQEDIKPQLQDSLRFLKNAGVLPHDDAMALFGSALENTIDTLRGLSTCADGAVSTNAGVALKELVKTIAGRIAMRQMWAMYDWKRDSGPSYSPDNYAWLACTCTQHSNWSIVTLNYDDLLDWAFRIIRTLGPSIPEPRQFNAWERSLAALFGGETPPLIDGGIYVKLHGSLQLFSCQNNTCPYYRVPYNNLEREDGRMVLRIPGGVCECSHCRTESAELILPPGKNKTKEESAYHDFVYARATAALRSSDVWAILGYSCPEYDWDVLDLMKRSLESGRPATGRDRSIIVIDPNAVAVAERLSQRLDRKVEVRFVNKGFSDFAKPWQPKDDSPEEIA